MIKVPKPKSIYALFLSFCLSTCLEAKDFGILGETFCIQEESILSFFQRQLSAKFSPAAYQQLLKNTAERAKYPISPAVPADAIQSAVYYYDPSFIAQETITDSLGTTLVTKGTLINPLQTVRLSSGLLFFDGNNPTHINWARKQQGNYKWILVQGSPFELEKQENRPIYFDQNGFSAHKFQLTHIPARITQEGLRLKIEEIPVYNQEPL